MVGSGIDGNQGSNERDGSNKTFHYSVTQAVVSRVRAFDAGKSVSQTAPIRFGR
ncbi:hypothetical protein RESH_04434 [Rhodopirellula europaea SH398]|uniref:Uncharacterized protein n=1 Tax=Rhodopirellula europaea SH398 TaxID=1263868 RepID=M5S011_9BACT|nr:hypothetical protein RESH_04434 [Rhodopirellula europaea SH398]